MEIALNNVELIPGHYISYAFTAGTIIGIAGSDRRRLIECIIRLQSRVLFSKDNPSLEISLVPLKKAIDTSRIAKDELCSSIKLKNQMFSEYMVDDLFKCLDVDGEILSKQICNLTFKEQKTLLLAAGLAGDNEVVILDSVEKGMHHKHKENLKKYLKKLVKDTKKTILVVTDDVMFMNDLIDDYIVVDGGKLVTSGTKKELYNIELYKYVDIPPIVEFTNYINAKKHHIKEYLEVKELLKAIYRDVENKR